MQFYFKVSTPTPLRTGTANMISGRMAHGYILACMDEASLQSETPSQQQLLTPKRKILIALVIWTIIITLADLVLEKTGADQFRVVATAAGTIGYGVLILGWTIADSRERGETLSHSWKFVLVAFGFFALLVYFFKSRGFVKALLAILHTLGFMVLTLILNTLVLVIVMIAMGYKK